ncbi:hypothetical protein Tco_1555006 [Tanacetum coccineum]
MQDQKPRFQRWYSRIVKALDSVIFNSSFTSSASFWEIRKGYHTKRQKTKKNKQNQARNGKAVKDKAKSKPKTRKVKFDESDTHVLERFDTSAGNPVKEILLKLNLPDHRILKDGGEGT